MQKTWNPTKKESNKIILSMENRQNLKTRQFDGIRMRDKQ